jgi:hypothetical protein
VGLQDQSRRESTTGSSIVPQYSSIDHGDAGAYPNTNPGTDAATYSNAGTHSNSNSNTNTNPDAAACDAAYAGAYQTPIPTPTPIG